MIKGIKYTKAMDNKLKTYQRKNLLTIAGLMTKVGLTETSLFKFRKREKISIQSLKKIKENL